MERRTRIILDTHIWIKLLGGDKRIQNRIGRFLTDKYEKNISIFSVWEIGMLNEKKRLDLPANIKIWLAQSIERSGVNVLPMDTDIALKSTSLPGNFHGDPGDRIIVATAIERKAILITEDKKILAYAKKGYVKAKSLL